MEQAVPAQRAAQYTSKKSPIPHGVRRRLFGFKEFLAGGAASGFAKTCVAPLSRVTALMQVQGMVPAYHQHMGVRNAMTLCKHVYLSEGVSAFWRGNSATVTQRFFMSGTTFSISGVCKRHFELGSVNSGCSPWTCSFLSALAGASVGVVVAQPLDVVKTRLMTQDRRIYKNIVGTVQRIIADEGASGLCKGLGVNVFSTVPTIAVNFMLYDVFRDLISDRKHGEAHKNTGARRDGGDLVYMLISGAAAGICSSVLFFPLDLVKRRMHLVGAQGCKAVYSSPVDAAFQIFRMGKAESPSWPSFGGLREFYRGLVPEVIKVAPGVAIMFAMNEYFLDLRFWPLD